MLKEFVDYLLAKCAIEKHEIDGRAYASRKLEPIQEPHLTPLKFLTLDSLIEFAKKYPKEDYMIHVEDEKCVHLLSQFPDAWNSRECPAKANITDFADEFEFDSFMESERFNIKLQSLFVDVADRAKVLQVIGCMAVEASVQVQDDGVTQRVTQQGGVALKTNADMPNPVQLAPFRTFREVGQPISKFVLRASKSASGKPQVALFEADGGAWRHEAIKNIATYLKAQLEGWTVLS